MSLDRVQNDFHEDYLIDGVVPIWFDPAKAECFIQSNRLGHRGCRIQTNSLIADLGSFSEDRRREPLAKSNSTVAGTNEHSLHLADPWLQPAKRHTTNHSVVPGNRQQQTAKRRAVVARQAIKFLTEILEPQVRR